jgi:tetratricopeptide (TPR) repeat protein
MPLKIRCSACAAIAFMLTTPALAQDSEAICNFAHLDICDKAVDNATTPEALIDAYYKRAAAMQVAKNYTQAIRDMTKVIALSDGSMIAQYYDMRGGIRDDAGDFAGAADDYTKAIEAPGGKQADYFNARAMAYENLDLTEEALNDYAAAIALEGDQPNWLAHYRRGLIYSSRKMFNEAIGDFTTSLQSLAATSDRDLAVNSYNQRGLAYLAVNKLTEARADFTASIKALDIHYVVPGITAPSELGSVNYNNRGKTGWLQGLAEKDIGRKTILMKAALADLEFAILLSPKPVARMFSNRGHLYYENAQLGELSAAAALLKKAQADFDKVLELAASNPESDLVKDAVKTKGDVKEFESTVALFSAMPSPPSALPLWAMPSASKPGPSR